MVREDMSLSTLCPDAPCALLNTAQCTLLQHVLRILLEYFTKQKTPTFPSGLEKHEELAALLQYVSDMRTVLTSLSHGSFQTPITLRGYTGGLLKALQGNIRHMLWMISQVAEGKLFHQVDYMGDFADSFNTMTRALQEARDALEHQKECYAALAEELRLEVAAKIKAQEELQYELERQRELATTDGLTGVANRRSFLQLAYHTLERSRRHNKPLCLAMLDVDYFKEINDSYGHQIGDMVLRHLTTTIARNLRSYDIIGRYGGDEFILLFPDTHRSGAAHTLERLHHAIKTGDFSDCGGIAFTISIGLAATFPHQNTMTLEDIIARADKALYLSKARGRNCVSVLGDEEA